MSDRENPSFVGFRQQHNHAYVSTKLSFKPIKEHEKAGLAIFQNETHYYYLCKSVAEGKPVIQLYQASKDTMMLLASHTLNSKNQDVYLRIEPNGGVYTMSYSENGKSWTALKDVDGKFLSTETAGGFVGCVFGLYATSQGKQSNSKVYFDWFDYKGDDDVFKMVKVDEGHNLEIGF